MSDDLLLTVKIHVKDERGLNDKQQNIQQSFEIKSTC